MRANMAATFSKARSLCYLASVFSILIYLFNFNQTPNVSKTWIKPTFCQVGKPSSRSVNVPHRPVTTWLKHGFVCVFLPRKDLTIFMDIELNPGPLHLSSSSFQPISALHKSSFPSTQKGSGLAAIGNDTVRYVYTKDDLINIRRMGICKLSYSAFLNVKSNGLLRYRGVRSGKAVKTRRQINQSMIPAMITANRPPTINTRSVNAANSIYPSTVESAKTNVPRLSLAVWNARSINRKAAMICDIITSNRLTETWLNSETNNVAIVEILNKLPDFTVFHIPRPNKKGGGIALFVRTSFNITKNLTPTFTSFEHLDITLSYKNFNFLLVVIYRPPPSTKNKLTTAKFFNEFADPIKSRWITHRPHAPWYNDDFRLAKRIKRRAERMFRKSGLEVHKQIFEEACNKYQKQLEFYKSSFYKSKIEQAGRNKLFRLVDKLFQPGSSALPSHTSLEVLVEDFNDFFIGKIQSIRDELQDTVNHSMQPQRRTLAYEFTMTPVSCSTVKNTIQSLSNKTCSLDPIPTFVIKNYADSISPIITNIVNQSLITGEFPSLLKLSHVRPRLKKDNLDKEVLKNYRPIVNIPFLSKVIEKVVATQTYNYLEAHNLMPTMQSAYRKHHSMETTLLRVTNDILRAIDRRQDVVLVLLDLSAAFDTIDHTILMERLESYFGFSKQTLSWFRSYLENRRQSIIIGDQMSTPSALHYGVPLGSILGPLLFTLYIAPLQDIIARHNLDSMFYADDTQLYIATDPANQVLSLTALRNCIEDVMRWNTQNMLRSNAEKTEVILFTSRFTKTPNIEKLSFDNIVIELTERVRDLGVTLDKNLSLTYHINETCKKATNSIRSIGRIRKYLTKENLKLLVNALVISRLDYCNSILYGLPKQELDKLQRIQNTAARLITGTKHYESIKPALRELHWLPIESRIIFKLLLITFKIIHGLCPAYLSPLLQQYCPQRNLRSSSKLLFTVPIVNSVTYGERAFSFSAPKLWNTLPNSVKNAPSLSTFKSALKTFLFRKFYC